VETVSETQSFGGVQGVYNHASKCTGTPMRFSVYTPAQASEGPVPILYYLSGLTCTEENFTTKAGAQRYAAEHGCIVVAPDTSPRGLELEGEHESWDFGSGAGFYVDATQAPWSAHYRMYSYITEELPELVEKKFPVDTQRRGIFGHSMGGHGALTIALRHPERYRSVSAFAPIVAPTQCPWGEKAFSGYLGSDRETWKQHDACELVRQRGFGTRILVDQGGADSFLEEQLKPQLFREACEVSGTELELRMQDGYDHSYYFIASFMGDHVAHHARILGGGD